MNEHVHICALTLHPPKPTFMHLPIKAARQFWVGLFEKTISDAPKSWQKVGKFKFNPYRLYIYIAYIDYRWSRWSILIDDPYSIDYPMIPLSMSHVWIFPAFGHSELVNKALPKPAPPNSAHAQRPWVFHRCMVQICEKKKIANIQNRLFDSLHSERTVASMDFFIFTSDSPRTTGCSELKI